MTIPAEPMDVICIYAQPSGYFVFSLSLFEF
uniref:Uncharacterized protein n=1 Tax=Siphoviridae sp. ctUcA20 TaxID=2825528 RepID=A0A8S5PMX9_9CAUD|nr:MAG TPA: hypothetical protein [Siphoviridae sp. ctUcA20]